MPRERRHASPTHGAGSTWADALSSARLPERAATPMEDAAADPAQLAARMMAAERGDVQATAELFTELYRELHRLARQQLYVNASGSTLGATTLLHETYLNLTRRGAAFPDRARFFAYAARAMRGLIIDYVRARRAQKRGGQFELTTLHTGIDGTSPDAADDMTALADALDALGGTEPALAELVDLKFFCGFDFAEIAAMRGVSERTVQRDWTKARLFLHDVLRDE
jgi:RNA polymerase sigma factor (TIGR02999 family)